MQLLYPETARSINQESAGAELKPERPVYSSPAGRSHDNLFQVLSAAGIGFWQFDPGTKLINGCPRFRALLGFTGEEKISMENIMDLLQKEDHFQFRKAISGVIRGEDLVYEIAVRPKNASGTFWLKISCGPSSKASLISYTLSGIIEDITELKNREAAKTDMMAYLNHELRSPLTSMKLYIQRAAQLAGEYGHDLIKTLLNKADEQLNSMNRMADTYLNQSNTESGRFALNNSYFNISAVLQEITDDFKEINPNHFFESDIPEAVWICADRQKIVQAVNNLISNAVKYSPQGSKVTLQCLNQSDTVMVMIKDEGIGIASPDISRLFNRFYRVTSAETKHIPGHGIGLYLVKNIIAAHGGKIAVTSSPKIGSAFYFTLPLRLQSGLFINDPQVIPGRSIH